MHSFTDEKGRAWSVVVTVDTVRRVRQLAGVDLMQVIKGPLLEELAGDPVKLVDVLFAICKPQADANKVTDQDFGESLAGDSIDTATMALLGAIADFFPSPTRKLLRKLIDAGQARQERIGVMLETVAQRAIDKADAAMAAAASTLGGSSPSAPASSDSIPAPAPSGS